MQTTEYARVVTRPLQGWSARRASSCLQGWRDWSPRTLAQAIDPSLGDQEQAYRRHYLRSDADQAILGMALLAVPLLFFAAGDYLLSGLGTTFALLVLLRLTFLWFSIEIARRLRRAPDARTFDWLIGVWETAGAATIVAAGVTRPVSYTQPLAMWVLVVLVGYLVVPNQLPLRLLLAAVFTGSALLLFLTGGRANDLLTTNLMWSTILLTNVVGIVVSTRISRLRRRQFVARLELERIRDQLEVMATTDALTGLLNRRGFLEACQDELDRTRRYGWPLSVIALDLDHFKDVNDRLGHAAGDDVLRTLARLLKNQARQHDIAGRLGGEEFAILLPETSIGDALALGERLRGRLGPLTLGIDGAPLTVTASFGVADVLPTDLSVEDALARADRALYRAKRGGRDRVEAA